MEVARYVDTCGSGVNPVKAHHEMKASLRGIGDKKPGTSLRCHQVSSPGKPWPGAPMRSSLVTHGAAENVSIIGDDPEVKRVFQESTGEGKQRSARLHPTIWEVQM